jgi:hypothetical protein
MRGSVLNSQKFVFNPYYLLYYIDIEKGGL